MKWLNDNRGYSMIEIGIGLLIIAVFSFFSLALFNGCYNNHRVVQQRNIALSYATNAMEYALQFDLADLGFTNAMLNRSSILTAARAASATELAEGNYAVPDDIVKGPDLTTNNMTITTQFRRVPTDLSEGAMDSTVIKVTVTVAYKVRVNDREARTIELTALKVTK
ncbi:MAG: hypothetical protein IJ217_00190 [Clostridia bacterium]|nr:hypothetical protein [Clostridia bacterium]